MVCEPSFRPEHSTLYRKQVACDRLRYTSAERPNFSGRSNAAGC
jgi:hypothetical protein